MTDEHQIRALIEAWAIAAHDGDLDTVLADHAPDIVMFDVSPPDQGAGPPRLTGRREWIELAVLALPGLHDHRSGWDASFDNLDSVLAARR